MKPVRSMLDFSTPVPQTIAITTLDESLHKEPGDLTTDDVLLMLGGDVDRAIADEALAGLTRDLDVEEANIRELEANQPSSD